MSTVWRLWIGFGAALATACALTAKADEVRLLATGQDSLIAREQLIRSARKSIDVVVYIFEPCQDSTQFLMHALVDRARAGVRTRILIDSHSMEKQTRRELALFLTQNKIQVKFFNERLSNFRSHIKLLAVDDAYIVGGRNTADDYFGLSKNYNFVDRDVIVRGTSVAQARASFEELWTTNLSAPTTSPTLDLTEFKKTCLRWASPSALQKKLTSMREGVPGRQFPARSCDKLKLVTDYPRFSDYNQDTVLGGESMESTRNRGRVLNKPAFQAKRASALYTKFVLGAKKSLSVENWSYIPYENVDRAFAKIRKAGVKVRVITNSEAEAGGVMDRPFNHVLKYYSERDTTGPQRVYRLAKDGHFQDDFDLTPKESTWRIHSKTAVRDEKDVVIGSYNIDPRSYGLNLELLLEIDDCPALAADVLGEDHRLSRTFKLDLRTCEKCKLPGAALFDRMMAWVVLGFL